MVAELDEVDIEIMNHICEGASSFSEIGEKCDISHNTVSRRINKMEEKGYLEKEMMAVPSFEKLGYSALIAGISIGLGEDVEKAVNILESYSQVKFLWKTFGDHDIIAVLMCDRENIGDCVESFRKELIDGGIELEGLEISTSISWEKLKLTP